MAKETVWERRARRCRVEKAAQKSRSPRPSVAADEGEGAPPPDEPVQLPEVLDLPAATSLAAALVERRGRPTVVDALLPAAARRAVSPGSHVRDQDLGGRRRSARFR